MPTVQEPYLSTTSKPMVKPEKAKGGPPQPVKTTGSPGGPHTPGAKKARKAKEKEVKKKTAKK